MSSGGSAVFDPSLLPEPALLARRHRALVVVEERVGGRQDSFSLSRSTAGAELMRFDSGSGDEYGLVLDGEAALLWVFDHECPYSPWGREDGASDWPGMLDGLPAALAAHLPALVPGEPRSISGCFWYADGAWRMGEPELSADAPEWADPQGATWLTAPLRDLEAGVAELVGEHYERPDLVEAMTHLARRAASPT